MYCNSVNARKMMSSVADANGPVILAHPEKAKIPDQDYPYSSDSDSTDSETFAASKKMDVLPKHRSKSPPPLKTPKRANKTQKPKIKPATTTKAAPAPPPPVSIVAPAPVLVVQEKEKEAEKKVRKPRAKKVKAPEVVATGATPAAPAEAQGTPLAPKESPAKKAKRAPSAYNKFVSTKMKEGLSMKAVADLWKAQKAGAGGA